VRIEHGRPRYGEDLQDRHLPRKLSYCTPALQSGLLPSAGDRRAHSLPGRRSRFLERLSIDATNASAGTKIVAAEKDVGELASAAWVARRRPGPGFGLPQAGRIPPRPLTSRGRAVRRLALRSPDPESIRRSIAARFTESIASSMCRNAMFLHPGAAGCLLPRRYPPGAPEAAPYDLREAARRSIPVSHAR